MKKILLLLFAVISVVSLHAQSIDGIYSGTCSNVYMNGKKVQDLSGIQLRIVNGSRYSLTGTIEFNKGIAYHKITLKDIQFDYDAATSTLSNFTGGGTVVVKLFNTITVANKPFEMEGDASGGINGVQLSLFFHATMPTYNDYDVKFNFTGNR